MVMLLVVLMATVLVQILFTQVSALNMCSKCGTMEVPYPLSTAANCGDPRYKINCNNDVLEFISAEGSSYKILSINPSKYTFVISPPKIKSDICYSSDLMVGGLKLDENLPFNISTRNTVMLLNCSDNILLSPLNCSSNSLCRQFEARVEEGTACKNTLCCTYLKDASLTQHRIRVRVGGCTAYTCVVNMDSREPPTSWNYGIELQWSPPNRI